jgi:hypothetical protein
MSTCRPRTALVGITLSALLATACGDGPQAAPVTRLADVSIHSPHAADQAIIVSFNLPVEGFEPRPGVRYFQDSRHGPTALLLVADRPLPPGEVWLGTVRLRGDDASGSPVARIVEVARSDFQLRKDLSAYQVLLFPR